MIQFLGARVLSHEQSREEQRVVAGRSGGGDGGGGGSMSQETNIKKKKKSKYNSQVPKKIHKEKIQTSSWFSLAGLFMQCL